MLSSATLKLNESEQLLWTILRSFESLALNQYEQNVPSLATKEKKELVHLLLSQVPSNEAIDPTTLAKPVSELLTVATSKGEVNTLIIQGLLLEVLGQTIYQTIKDSDVFTAPTKELSDVGLAARASIKDETNKLLVTQVGSPEEIYQAFITISKPVVLKLETLGESLDTYFSEKFEISFSDLMGEFVAELLSTCMDLGMERRKVVSYLTSTLMGI